MMGLLGFTSGEITVNLSFVLIDANKLGIYFPFLHTHFLVNHKFSNYAPMGGKTLENKLVSVLTTN